MQVNVFSFDLLSSIGSTRAVLGLVGNQPSLPYGKSHRPSRLFPRSPKNCIQRQSWEDANMQSTRSSFAQPRCYGICDDHSVEQEIDRAKYSELIFLR